MESAQQERTTVDAVSSDGQTTLRVTGTVTVFDGFLTLYQEGRDDDQDSEAGNLPGAGQGRFAVHKNYQAGTAFHRAATAILRSESP